MAVKRNKAAATVTSETANEESTMQNQTSDQTSDQTTDQTSEGEGEGSDQTTDQTTDQTDGGEGEGEGSDQTSEGEGKAAGKKAKRAERSRDEFAADDTARASYVVTVEAVEGSAPDNMGLDAVTLEVQRLSAGAYIGVIATGARIVEGAVCSSGKAAVSSALRAAYSFPVTVWTYPDIAAIEAASAPMPGGNAAGHNSGAYFWQVEGEAAARLEALQFGLVEANAAIERGEDESLVGWHAFGTAYRAIGDLFASAEESEDRSNKARGAWINEKLSNLPHLQERMKSKNAGTKAAFLSLAPLDMVRALDIRTASMFEKVAGETRRELADTVAQFVCPVKGQPIDDKWTPENTLNELLARHDGSVARNEATIAEHVAKYAKDVAAGKGMPPVAPAVAAYSRRIPLYEWLLDLFGEKIVAAGLKLAAERAATVEQSDEEKADATAKAAAEGVAGKFAKLTVEQAARHLYTILDAHPNAAEVYEVLGLILADAEGEGEGEGSDQTDH